MGHVMSYYKNQQDTRKWEDEGIDKEEINYPNLKPKKLDKNIAYNYDIIQKDQ